MIFPAFNEAQNIPLTLQAALTTLPRLVEDFEIIVVDDGSADQTRAIAEDFMAADPRVRTVHHPRNRGYGAALRSGIIASEGERIFFTDADLQFDIAELRQLLRWADQYDIVAGYRAVRSDPAGRRLNAWAWGQLVNALFEMEIRDVDCAFKVFHRRVFERIPIASVGAFVNTEILVRARGEGFTLHQVPVSHYPRVHGQPTGANPRVILKAFAELYRLHGELMGERSSFGPGVLAGTDGG